MPRRLIPDAENRLASLNISPADRAKLQREIDNAKAQAEASAQRVTAARLATVDERMPDLEAKVQELGDHVQQLLDAPEGSVTSAQLAQAYSDLEMAHGAVRKAAALLNAEVESAAAIEQDPLAYANDLHQRFESIRPVFSF